MSNGLLPVISKPTRITHKTATLIDNIYISNQSFKKFKSSIILSHISDHFPCMLVIDKNVDKTKQPMTVKYRDINKVNIKLINNELLLTDWSCLQDMHVNDSYNFVINKINYTLDK